MSTPVLDQVLRWVVVHPFVDEPPPTTGPLSPAEWDEMLSFVTSERVVGQLAVAVVAGLPATETQARQAVEAHREAMMWDVQVESSLLCLAEVFDGAGLEWRVIKGLAAGRVLYAEAGMRSTGDVDVLVHPDDYHHALDLVRQAGLVDWEYPAHGPFSERVERGHTFVTAGGVELDVHRWIQGAIPSVSIPTRAMFENPTPIVVQGVPMLAPSPDMVVLHAMLHLATGYPGRNSLARLSTLMDLVGSRGRLPAVYAEALEAAPQCGSGTAARWADVVVRAWLSGEGARPTIDWPSRLWVYDRMLRVRGLPEVTARLSGPRRLRRSFEAFAPSAEYRDINHRSRVAQVRHVADRVLGVGRR